jgi:hypothetical protein
MIDAVTVVWLAPNLQTEPSFARTRRPAEPGDEARRALEAWAGARGVKLEAAAEADAPATPIDWGAAETVEREIARARDALAALDFDAAERALARAQVVLRDHAELPQAAWLRAEVERGWSVRWLRDGDEARAKRAWQRAAGLDGGREPGLGEKAFEGAGTVTASIRLTGAEGAGLRLDGVKIAPGEVTRTEGEHALAIVRADGATSYAAWVSLAQGEEVKLEAPESPACSRAAMARARLEAVRVRAVGVRCEKWVAAVADGVGVVRVATCEGETCGPLVEWRSIAPSGERTGAAAESRSKWPAWATWALVGVGVAGAAVGVAAAAGAFKSTPAQETQFVNGGLKVSGF